MYLYEMTAQGKALYEMLTEEMPDASTDAEAYAERQQIIRDTMEAIGAEEKLETYAKIIRQIENYTDGLKAEKARIDKQIKSNDGNVKRMKIAIADYLDAINEKKVQAGTFKLSRRADTRSISVINEQALDARFFTEKTTRTPSKTLIAEAIDAGEQVNGIEIVMTKGVTIR